MDTNQHELFHYDYDYQSVSDFRQDCFDLEGARRLGEIRQRQPGIGHKGKMPLLPTPDIAFWQFSQGFQPWYFRPERSDPGAWRAGGTRRLGEIRQCQPGIGHKGKMPLLPTPDIAFWAECSRPVMQSWFPQYS